MSSAVSLTKKWLEEIIIGLNLCPFASSVFLQDKVRFFASPAVETEDVVGDGLEQAMLLLEASPDEVATSLIIYPQAMSSFDEYLDTLALFEDVLAQAGAEGLLQVASFHPQYMFEGEDQSSVSHFTNRSPYPIFHLLRESQVEEVVESHPDTEGIPRENIERLQSLGPTKVAKIWKNFLDL